MKKQTLVRAAFATVFVGLAVATETLALPTRTQNFTSDPGWGSLGNTTSPHNYGFRNTSHLTGASAGEAGGTFGRSNFPNHYGDTNLTEELNLNFRLEVTGKLTADAYNGLDGSFQIGYFDQTDGFDFLGLIVLEPSTPPSPFRLGLALVRSDQTVRVEIPGSSATITTGKDYEFAFTYDPQANSGNGALSATVTGIDVVGSSSFTLNLLAGDRLTSTRFNAFGVRSGVASPVAGSAEFFVDDLTYTIPEPSTLGLFALAIAGLLYHRRTNQP